MATTQDGSWLKNSSTCAHRIFLRRTACHAPSAPYTWNTFFARSSPTLIISDMTAPLCGSLQTHLGTSDAVGGGHIINAVLHLPPLKTYAFTAANNASYNLY